jgi:hypothetical protein
MFDAGAMRFSYRIEDGGHEGKESSRTFKIMPATEPAQMKGQAIFTPTRFRPPWLSLSKKAGQTRRGE